MQFDWNDLKYFLAVARLGSVAKAADDLGVNQSTVLRRIDAMEERLNLTLFVREKGSYRLTDAGELVQASARRMDEQALELERRLAGYDNAAAEGEVVVTAPSFVVTHMIGPALGGFMEEHKGITLSLKTTSDFLDLSRRDADVAVRLTDDPKTHLPDNLVGRKVADIELCAYVAKDAKTDDLGWIAWSKAVDFNGWIERNGYPKHPVRLVCDNPLAQMKVLPFAPLAAVLPCFIGDKRDALVRLDGCEPFTAFEAWVVTHPDLKRATRINAVTAFLAGVMGG